VKRNLRLRSDQTWTNWSNTSKYQNRKVHVAIDSTKCPISFEIAVDFEIVAEYGGNKFEETDDFRFRKIYLPHFFHFNKFRTLNRFTGLQYRSQK